MTLSEFQLSVDYNGTEIGHFMMPALDIVQGEASQMLEITSLFFITNKKQWLLFTLDMIQVEN